MLKSEPKSREFKLEPGCELRFEIESKNEKVSLEVCNVLVTLSFIFIHCSSGRKYSFVLFFIMALCIL